MVGNVQYTWSVYERYCTGMSQVLELHRSLYRGLIPDGNMPSPMSYQADYFLPEGRQGTQKVPLARRMRS